MGINWAKLRITESALLVLLHHHLTVGFQNKNKNHHVVRLKAYSTVGTLTLEWVGGNIHTN
jgi:hypothetical protein